MSHVQDLLVTGGPAPVIVEDKFELAAHQASGITAF